jgi:2,3-bisphosphoglycerate-dependent phosphoglycerate mutase
VSLPYYLVRHGESEWNVQRLTQGQTMHPRLTARGRAQATQAARTIAYDLAASGLEAGSVTTSDLVRARETAEIIVEFLGAELTVDERLREQHLGALQGMSYDETFALAATVDWSVPDQSIAGGESLHQVRDRVAAALSSIDPTSVATLVSHGDAIRVAVAHAAGIEPHRAPWVEVPNGAVARIDGRHATWLPQALRV